MSRPEDDADASTMAAGGATLADRSSRPVIEGLAAGAMVGRYRLVSRLGAGAMGVVWSARDPELDRDVAIKLVHPALHSDEAASRFRREARAMAKLSHRSVITVHDTGVVDGQLFLAMELVRGTTLGQLLRERTPEDIADWPRWLAMLIDAGRGLAEAHRNGVLHRDFKPDNVLVDKTGRVCVGDFGLASLGDRQVARPSSSAIHPITLGDSVAFDLTTTGAVLGTPLYMSPQQLNAEAIDERADQFAFSVALHEALYGKRPFATEAQGLAAIPGLIEKIATGVPSPPNGTPVPKAIHDCIVRGLAFEPEQRWTDMDALIAALEEAQRKSRATSAIEPPRRRWVMPAIALGILGAGAVIAIVALREPETVAPPPPPPPPIVKQAKPPPKAELELLFYTPLNTRTAISRDGRFIAQSGERLEVRRIDEAGKEPEVLKSMPAPAPLVHIEVDAREVRYASHANNGKWAWRYLEDGPPVEIGRVQGTWRGTTVAGELVRIDHRGLGIDKPSGELEEWPVRDIEIVTISPDRRLVAYVEGGRFNGKIFVRDATTGTVIASDQIPEPMALAWLDSKTLLYASSTMVDPTIYRVEVGAAFGKPTPVYSQQSGWFSDMGVGGETVFIVSMLPTPRGRVIERGGANNELDSISLAIGWDAEDHVMTWNSATKQISSHAGTLGSEPANATRVGDSLIASLRVLGGRRAVAVSLTTGRELWRHPDANTIAVRCADDRAAPCIAIRHIDETIDRIVTLDPATGALGDKAIYQHKKIEDAALRADGKALLVTEGARVRELWIDGTSIEEHELRDATGKITLNLVRSVAYSKHGFVVAGTVGRNAYQVGEVRKGRYEKLGNAFDKILMLARPSSDGSKVAFLARGYEPKLYRLKLP